MERNDIEANIIQAATLYRSTGPDNDIIDEDVFDLHKFTRLIQDLVCIRDEILYLPENQSISALIEAIAAHVEVPHGAQTIEIRHLVQLFLKWPEVLQNEVVERAGGQNLPNLCDPLTLLDIQELSRQRGLSNTFHSHRRHDWLYTSGDHRGLIVPMEMILEHNNWKFHDHKDGTGLLYLWPGSNTADGQRNLLNGTTLGYYVQRATSVGSPRPRNTQPQEVIHPQPETRQQNSLDKVEDLEMKSDNTISLPTDTPDPRNVLVAAVNERIERLGYTAIEVGSGGDCFFRCLSAQIPFFNFQPSDENSLLARQLIVEFLSTNQSLYQDFIAYDSQTPSFQTYLQRMSQANTWIEGGLEVLAASIVFNVRIHIFGANSTYDRVVSPPQANHETRDIEMVHYHDYHYRVLQRAPTL